MKLIADMNLKELKAHYDWADMENLLLVIKGLNFNLDTQITVNRNLFKISINNGELE